MRRMRRMWHEFEAFVALRICQFSDFSVEMFCLLFSLLHATFEVRLKEQRCGDVLQTTHTGYIILTATVPGPLPLYLTVSLSLCMCVCAAWVAFRVRESMQQQQQQQAPSSSARVIFTSYYLSIYPLSQQPNRHFNATAQHPMSPLIARTYYPLHPLGTHFPYPSPNMNTHSLACVKPHDGCVRTALRLLLILNTL